MLLIIIASVTVSTALGDNGLVEKVKLEQAKQHKEQLHRDIELKILQKQKDEYMGTVVDSNSFEQQYLRKIEGATVTKVASDTWYVEKEGNIVTVYQDGSVIEGKIELWTGGSEIPEFADFNWYIYNAEQLKFFADFVNNGNALTTSQQTLINEQTKYNADDIKIEETTIVYLMNDIDLGAREGSVDGTLTWDTTENTALNWTPIGDTHNSTTKEGKFTGTFEGNGHIIRGLYVLSNANFSGLFGNSDTIQNLTIKNSYVRSTQKATGGIVGALREGNLTNCHNINTQVIGENSSIGGIVGQFTGTKIENCSNNGTVNGVSFEEIVSEEIKFQSIGGICGLFRGTVENCTNRGKIIGQASRDIGGIIRCDI